jgi:hypothetical protein
MVLGKLSNKFNLKPLIREHTHENDLPFIYPFLSHPGKRTDIDQ